MRPWLDLIIDPPRGVHLRLHLYLSLKLLTALWPYCSSGRESPESRLQREDISGERSHAPCSGDREDAEALRVINLNPKGPFPRRESRRSVGPNQLPRLGRNTKGGQSSWRRKCYVVFRRTSCQRVQYIHQVGSPQRSRHICAATMSSPAQVLTPGVGAAVVVSVAIGLSMLMLVILFCMRRYSAPTEHSNDNDEFSSASRSVKPGLVACAIVSAWTWAATLQQSAAVAYKWGISGPFW